MSGETTREQGEPARVSEVVRELGLRREVLARTLPFFMTLVAIFGLSAPTAFYLVRVGELRAEADHSATLLARRLAREAQGRPALWSYDSGKLLDLLRPLRRESVAEVRVLDGAQRVAASEGEIGEQPVAWESAPILVGEEVRGQVWIAASLGAARRTAALLLIPFFALGAILAGLLLWLPQRALQRAERRIGGLLGDLEASRASLAALNEDLEAQVAARLVELERANMELREKDARLLALSTRAAAIYERERRAIGRDLHDAAGQVLTAIRIQLQVLDHADEASRPQLIQATAELIDEVMDEIRRAVAALGPAVLAEIGLAEAAQRHAADVAERSGLDIACTIEGEVARPPAVESACYRALQEALSNVQKHANAHSVRVLLRDRAGVLELEVEDDGRGFDSKVIRPVIGRGLSNLVERAELLGGEGRVESAPGQGTRVRLLFPDVSGLDDELVG